MRPPPSDTSPLQARSFCPQKARSGVFVNARGLKSFYVVFMSRSGLAGWRLGVAGVNAVSRATLNMRPCAFIVKHLNH